MSIEAGLILGSINIAVFFAFLGISIKDQHAPMRVFFILLSMLFMVSAIFVTGAVVEETTYAELAGPFFITAKVAFFAWFFFTVYMIIQYIRSVGETWRDREFELDV